VNPIINDIIANFSKIRHLQRESGRVQTACHGARKVIKCVPVPTLDLGPDHEPKNPKNLEAFVFRGIFGRKARKRK
jgi:hypothetical protein